MLDRTPIIYVLERIVDEKDTFQVALLKAEDRYNLSQLDKQALKANAFEALRHFFLFAYEIESAFPESKDTGRLEFLLISALASLRKKADPNDVKASVLKTAEINQLKFDEAGFDKLISLSQSTPTLGEDVTSDRLLNDSLLLNCPEWVLSEYSQAYGPKKAVDIAVSLLKAPNLFLSLNPKKAKAEDYKDNPAYAWFPSLAETFSDGGLVLSKKEKRASKIPDVLSGKLYVQEKSWFDFLDRLPYLQYGKILHAGANSGALAAGLALRADSRQGKVTAVYGDNKRQSRGKALHDRLGLDNVEELVSSIPMLKTIMPFDGYDLVVSTPSSTHLGQARRRPDVNVTFDPDDLTVTMDNEDSDLLESSFFVAKGGVLAYAVPSILPEEGSQRIQAFLEARKNFALVTQKTILPIPETAEEPLTDGLYFAILTRKEADNG